MIIQPKETTIAYRCPECGATVHSVVGIFALSGDRIKLKCSCGGSELLIENTADGKMRFTVPCIFCPNPHSFLISRKTILSRELFTIPCGLAGYDICFIGSEDKVREAVEQSDKELYEEISAEELRSIKESNSEDSYYDEHIADMLIYVFGDLCEEGKIHCNCKDGGDYLCEKDKDCVRISCQKCGASLEVEAEDSPATHAVLHANEIYLN